MAERSTQSEVADVLKIDLPQLTLGDSNELDLQINDEEMQKMSEISDHVLQSLETLRLKSLEFENEIKQLNADMSLIENHSHKFASKLAIREAVIGLIDSKVAKYTLPLELVNCLLYKEFNSEYFQYLQRLEEFDFNASDDSLIYKDSLNLHRALISTVLDRYKHHFVLLLRNLRRPGRDAESIQKLLIGLGPLNKFAAKHAPQLFETLVAAYSNTMKWYYNMLFGKYGRWLSRQPIWSVDHPKLLGNLSHSNVSMANLRDVDSFSIGARPSVLSTDFEPLFMTAQPPAQMPYYPIEILAGSLIMALLNSVNMENDVNISLQMSLDIKQIFNPVYEFYEILLAKWIQQCRGDLFGLTLVQILLLRVENLGWGSQLIESCKSDVKLILTAQAKSIESAALKASVKSGRHLNFGGPHPLTQLVSSYLSGILQLPLPDLDSKELKTGIREVVEAYELFISKLASGDERILHSNYYVMFTLLTDLEGDLGAGLGKHFEMLVNVFNK